MNSHFLVPFHTFKDPTIETSQYLHCISPRIDYTFELLSKPDTTVSMVAHIPPMVLVLTDSNFQPHNQTTRPLSSKYSSFSSTPPIDMQSSFNYTDSPYSSSPGSMDFYFYGSPQIYDTTYDVDPASPFAMSDVMSEACSFPSSFTSSPYMIPPMNDFTPVYDHPTLATSIPSSASSTCSSIYGSMAQPEEVPMPIYPLSRYDSYPDSPSQTKYVRPFLASPKPCHTNLFMYRPTKPYPCDSCGKSFTRVADLKRHQSSVHNPVFRNCPVEHCSRKGSNGFPRQDHLVEHLRSYHHLDVPKRRVLKRSGKEAV